MFFKNQVSYWFLFTPRYDDCVNPWLFSAFLPVSQRNANCASNEEYQCSASQNDRTIVKCHNRISALRKGSRLDLQNLVGPVSNLQNSSATFSGHSGKSLRLSVWWHKHMLWKAHCISISFCAVAHSSRVVASSRVIHTGSMLALTCPNAGSALELTHPMPAESTGRTAKAPRGSSRSLWDSLHEVLTWKETVTTEKHKPVTKV